MTHLNTRLVVPLLPLDGALKPGKGLNPEFKIGDVAVVMVTQFLAAVPTSVLRDQVATLEPHHTTIVDAIDLLMQGF